MVLLSLAVPLLGYAVLSGAKRADRSLLRQAIAMVAFGAAAIAALGTNDDVGAYLVASAWLATQSGMRITTGRTWRRCARTPSYASCWTRCSLLVDPYDPDGGEGHDVGGEAGPAVPQV